MKKSNAAEKKSSLVFTGYLLQEDNGFSAICTDVDVASDGDSPEDAKKNLMEAIELYIESAIENNLPVLRPIPPCDNPILNRASDIVHSFPMKVNLEVNIHA